MVLQFEMLIRKKISPPHSHTHKIYLLCHLYVFQYRRLLFHNISKEEGCKQKNIVPLFTRAHSLYLTKFIRTRYSQEESKNTKTLQTKNYTCCVFKIYDCRWPIKVGLLMSRALK